MVTSTAEPLPPTEAVEAAIARVLAAERAAREDVARAKDDAVAMTEAARAAGRTLNERTERRIRALYVAFDRKTSASLATLEDEVARLATHSRLFCQRASPYRKGGRQACRRAHRRRRMIELDGLEYAQARLWARNGERPDEVEWRRIEVIRDLGAVLDAARETRLRHWTTGIAAQDGAYEIETTLRRHGRRLVAEVTGWMPAEWRDAVAWCGVLIDLPTLAYLARAGEPLAWMRDDPVYRKLCSDAPAARSVDAAKRTACPVGSGMGQCRSVSHPVARRVDAAIAAKPLRYAARRTHWQRCWKHISLFSQAQPLARLGRCVARCRSGSSRSFVVPCSTRQRRSFFSRSPRWISSDCAGSWCAARHSRARHSRHDPSAAGAVVRNPRCAR